MRLRDYFNGYRLTLRSPLPVREIEDRINAGVASRDNPFRSGITGEAGFGMFELRFVHFWWKQKGKPRLAGRIFEDANGSRIEIYFGASVIVFVGTLGLCAVMAWLAINLVSRWWTLSMTPGDPLLVLFLPFFLLSWISTHHLITARSDDDFEAMMEFIATVAEARVDRRRVPGRRIFGPTIL
jgi:hypothetical protein